LGSKDANGFSPLVKLIFADGKRIEARFSQIHTITYKSALTNYLAQITADENIEFGTNGALTVSINNEIYRGTLYPELSGGDLASKEIVFTAINDVDGNGHNDFTVKYADNTEQTLYIVSVPGSDDVVVDPVPTVEEAPVVDDADPVEPSSDVTEPTDATTDNSTTVEPGVTTDSSTTVEPSVTTDNSTTVETAETVKPVDNTTETPVAPVQPTETVAPAVTSEPLVEVAPPVETAPVVSEPAPVVAEPAVVVTETPAAE
jgi:hypothetical protein